MEFTEWEIEMTPIFDTHAHYDDEAFDEDRDALLSSFPANGIGKVTNVGASLASCEHTVKLMHNYDFLYGAIGVHPTETAELNEENFRRVEEWCREPKCVAVGEIGLDYYWDEPGREIQKKWFVRQLQLARELGLPAVIHSREAAKDTVDLMTQQHAEEIGGVIHCFSYTVETAKIFLDMGFYLGIGGVLTYKNAKKLVETVEYAPLDRLVLETDCPYLTPVPNRGKRNCSLNIPYVVEKIAQLKGITEEEVRRVTWENAHRLYSIPIQ